MATDLLKGVQARQSTPPFDVRMVSTALETAAASSSCVSPARFRADFTRMPM